MALCSISGSKFFEEVAKLKSVSPDGHMHSKQQTSNLCETSTRSSVGKFSPCLPAYFIVYLRKLVALTKAVGSAGNLHTVVVMCHGKVILPKPHSRSCKRKVLKRCAPLDHVQPFVSLNADNIKQDAKRAKEGFDLPSSCTARQCLAHYRRLAQTEGKTFALPRKGRGQLTGPAFS